MNKLSEGKTAGIVTGKSQHSAYDFFEKIETNFLEKYLLYLIRDDQGHLFLTNNDIVENTQNQVYLYNVGRQFQMSQLMDSFSKQLNQFENQPDVGIPKSAKKKGSAFMKIYENDEAKQDNPIHQNELIYIYSRFKVTHQKLKDSGELIKRQLLKEREIIKKGQQQQSETSSSSQKENQIVNSGEIQEENKREIINVLFFYTGDVNFRFQNDVVFNQNQCILHDKQYKLRINIYYVSKVILFSYFCKVNNLNIEQIDDKTITLFELKRMSMRRRKQALLKANKAKTPTNRSQVSLKNSSNVNLEKNPQKRLSNSTTQLIENKEQKTQEDQNQQQQPGSSSYLDQIRGHRRNITSLDGVKQLPPFAQLTLILGLSVGAPLLIKKCLNNQYVKNIFAPKK